MGFNLFPKTLLGVLPVQIHLLVLLLLLMVLVLGLWLFSEGILLLAKVGSSGVMSFAKCIAMVNGLQHVFVRGEFPAWTAAPGASS